jgi:ABC-type bacteriocin/lantibiotic exporters, contain an N-terminal double-glycine peptidase domain
LTAKRGLETSIKESSYKYETTGWLEEIARLLYTFKLNKNYALSTRKMDEKVSLYLQYRTRHFNILLFQFKNLVFLKIMITGAMLIVGTFLLINQQLNIGQFVAAEIIIISIISSVENLITNLDTFYDILTCVDKLEIIHSLHKEEEGSTPFIENPNGMDVEFSKVDFGYDDNNTVFKNVNFHINAGEKVAITGVEGVGKSTMLKLLSSMYMPLSGNILFNDISVKNLDLDDLRSHIKLMLNRLDIFKGSVIENITLGNQSISIIDIIEWSKLIGLDDYINQLPKGYETIIDSTGKRLPRTVIKKIIFCVPLC